METLFIILAAYRATIKSVKSGHLDRIGDPAMRKSAKTILALIILFISVIFGNSAYAQSGSWKVSESQGDVSISHQGVTKVAVKGAALSAGDSIKTGANGRAVITRGEQYVVVSRNSHIKVAPQKTKSLLTQFVQYFGNALFKVDKRKDQHFAVETPYMAAVVKGTTFNVSVGAEGATVQVTEGAVEVATLDGGARELLLPGDIGLVERGDPFSLGIRGRNTRSIESRNKPAETAAPAVKAEPVTTAAITAPAITEAVPSAPAIKEIRVASVDLAGLTDGLIEGNSPGIIEAESDNIPDDIKDDSNADQALFNAVTAVNTNADLADGNALPDTGDAEAPLLDVDMDVVTGGMTPGDEGPEDGFADNDNIVDDIIEMPAIEDDLPDNDGDKTPDADDNGIDNVATPELPEPTLPDNEVELPVEELPVADLPDDNDPDIDADQPDDDGDDGNNGHGNDDDGNDDSNPGNGNRNDGDDYDDDRDDDERDERDDDRDERDDDRNERDDDDDDDDDRGGRRCRTLACAIIREILD